MSDDFSPYAPPQSEVEERLEGGLAHRTVVDIGEAFGFVFKDPDWIMRCLVMGLVALLIPIVGMLMLIGWEARIFERVRQGGAPQLPEIDLGGDLGRGVAPFVALLTTTLPFTLLMMGGMFVIMVPFIALSGGGEPDGAMGLVFGLLMMGVYGGMMVFSLALQVLMPEIYRRGFLGDMVPLLRFRESWADIRDNVGPFLVTFLGWFIAGFVASMGMFACFVGILVTLPMSIAIQGHLAAQWDQVARGRAGDRDVAF
ncbi:MAG: DUF4013 domain-containing protein [Alphaproteobacteria bacterium]|nr:DUF4013 domain-containing protein [Alphaproteobacteria bacterium]